MGVGACTFFFAIFFLDNFPFLDNLPFLDNFPFLLHLDVNNLQ
jgi:hypothetical protein